MSISWKIYTEDGRNPLIKHCSNVYAYPKVIHIFWIQIYHISKLPQSIYVRINYKNNCHALNACYVLHTSYIWFLVLTKHPWNQYHYLTLAFQQRRTVGFMWLAQVHPVVRHWGGIQTQTCWTPNTVLFLLQQHIDSFVGSLHINELMRHSGLQEGDIKSYPTFFACK